MTLITFAESVAHYESRESGLGSRFRDEVVAVVDWILRFPEVDMTANKSLETNRR